ncbi:MAG: glycosyltransferase family protein [Magnetococcales bacterium]|nr:glycosyltransferase family protein [Magnetococcales bacterium]
MNRKHRPGPPPPPQVVTPAMSYQVPPLVEQMFNEAVARHQANQLLQAEALYRAILALEPGHVSASYNAGVLLQTQGRQEEAVLFYKNAVTVKPDYSEAYCNLGTALQDLGRLDEAVAIYQQAISIRPDFAMAYCNLGVALKMQGKLPESIQAYQQAIRLNPQYDWAYANMGAAYMDMGLLDESLAAAQKAITLNPTMIMGYFNLGTVYKGLNRLSEAEQIFRQAIALQPSFVEAHFVLGQVLLTQGRLAEGWGEYEWRWNLKEYGWLKSLHGEFSQPRWNGEPLQGKTILVYAEQGMGDTIQYVRYLPWLVDMGATVILAVHPPLVTLFSQLKRIFVIPLDQKPLPAFDYHSPLLSLPRLQGTQLFNVPANVPYLHADENLVQQWLPRLGGGLRVGLVWAGNPTQKGDKFRSPRLASMFPLFDIPGVTFIALQVGEGRQDLQQYPLPPHVIDLGKEIKDFSDTAAIMKSLDLMITSCTAPLHLAGALGVRTWGVIPYSPHFLWMLNREDSPWYPTLRLYRQDRYDVNWSQVIQQVRQDLLALRSA